MPATPAPTSGAGTGTPAMAGVVDKAINDTRPKSFFILPPLDSELSVKSLAVSSYFVKSAHFPLEYERLPASRRDDPSFSAQKA